MNALPVVKHLMRRYASDAKKRGYKFNLSVDTFANIIVGNCVYCGCAPKNIYTQKQYAVKSIAYNGVDRVDNARGYDDGNVVSCCEGCNKSKRDRESVNPAYVAKRRQSLREIA